MLPTPLVQTLESRARSMGLEVGDYIAQLAELAIGAHLLEGMARSAGMDVLSFVQFARSVAQREHDAAFVDAARFAFSSYPDTLRGLAQ